MENLGNYKTFHFEVENIINRNTIKTKSLLPRGTGLWSRSMLMLLPLLAQLTPGNF